MGILRSQIRGEKGRLAWKEVEVDPPLLICAESMPLLYQQLPIPVTCFTATLHAATKARVTSCDGLSHKAQRMERRSYSVCVCVSAYTCVCVWWGMQAKGESSSEISGNSTAEHITWELLYSDAFKLVYVLVTVGGEVLYLTTLSIVILLLKAKI